MVLWYLPVVRLSMQMFPCMDYESDDVDATQNRTLTVDRTLIVDPEVPCSDLFWARLHSVIILGGVGLGFPLFIIWKLRKLRERNRLIASSTFASIFHFYTDQFASFETAHCFRKALLIAATLQYYPKPDQTYEARIEALATFFINAGFVFVLLFFKVGEIRA